MITNGIAIKWHGGIEYIEIDLDALDCLMEIVSTLEWWNSDKKFVRYNTISSVEHLNDGVVKLTIKYNHESNTHLKREDVLWGTSIFTFLPNKSEGSVEWIGSETSEYDDKADWKRFTIDLISQKSRKTVSQLERKQQMFRSALFTYESSCAITKETTIAALEAAHIIPAKDGGAEVVKNGILFRADIHRLYDAGAFSIDLTGSIINVKDDISPEYLTILNNARIPDVTLVRIKDALKYQLDNAVSK